MSGLTDPSFFPFFTGFAFAIFVSLLSSFCISAAYTAPDAILAPNCQL